MKVNTFYPNMTNRLVNILLTLTIIIQQTRCFEFKAIYVDPDLYSVGQRTTYTFIADRATRPDLNPTAYDSESVPTGSTIVITFPAQYSLSSISCSEVHVSTLTDSLNVSGYSCSLSGQQLTVSNIFLNPMYVSQVTVKVANILNPSFSITTDNFLMRIGNDYSSNDSYASVTLYPTYFMQVNATFDNRTVNTTGNMIVTFVSQNVIRQGSNVVVTFPATLKWQRDISISHTIPITSSLTCSGLTANLKSSLSCVGSSFTRQIVLSSVNSVQIAANQTVSFKIGPLFSPPSTEQIDYIYVQTQSLYSDGNYYSVDWDYTRITGLVPKTMSVSVSSTVKMIVNTKISIQVQVVLSDTIFQNDTFRVQFPGVVGFNYTYGIWNLTPFNLNSNATVYDSASKILELKMFNNQTQVYYANRAIRFIVSTFTVPPSIKQFQTMFKVMRNGYTMAQGSALTSAVANNYSGSVSALDLGVNRITRYDIVVDVKDSHTAGMMIEVMLPMTLTIDPLTISAKTSLSSTVTPIINVSVSTNLITLTNLVPLNTSLIPAQLLTISLFNLTNPSSVKNIGNFQVKTYYVADYLQKVSESTIVTTIATMSGQILQNTVKIIPSSFVNYQLTTYNVQLVVANWIQINGYITITLPSELNLTLLTSVMISTTTISLQPISFTLTSSSSIKLTNNITLIPSRTQLNLVLNKIRNPTSTKPTQLKQFQVRSYNSLSQTIDILNPNNSISLQTTSLNLLTSTTLTRGSVKNDDVNDWIVTFTQVQPIQNGQKVILVIDNTVALPVTLLCVDNNTLLSVSCNKLSTRPTSLSSVNSSSTLISIDIPISYIGLNQFSFKIKNIQNPSSFSPFSFSLYTSTTNLLYLYSSIDQSSQNSQPSDIIISSFQFTTRQLKASTVLWFSYTVMSGFTSMLVKLDNSGFDANSASCISTEWPQLSCTIVNNTTINISSSTTSSLAPLQANITLSNIVTPSATSPVPIYIKLSTFNSNNYSMAINTNSISYSLQCTFPCKTCLSSNTSYCSSCYQASLSTKVYLGIDHLCYQQCPDGFNQNVVSFTCEKCQAPCLNCNKLNSNCTSCNLTSQYTYLSYNNITDISTCLKSCPSQYYLDTNSLPLYCQRCSSPCLQCKNSTFCLSCQNTNVSQLLYLLNGKCVTTCPADVTIINATDNSCVSCSPACQTCSITVSNCTTCSNISIFYLGKCLTQCPLNLLKYNSTCVACDPKCQTCSILQTNCTSCIKSSLYPYYFQNDCLNKCPNYFYPNSTLICLQCSLLGIGCKNCSTQTTCLSCDSGLVLLVDKCLLTVPAGYLNISGVAVPCSGDCKTCQGTLDNCTSCKTLNLNGNLCQATCNIGQTAIRQVCTQCQYPCLTCSQQVNFCSSCFMNSSTFLYSSSCLANCPSNYYKNTINTTCSPCVSPCQQCSNAATCISCVSGYFLYSNTSECLLLCPSGMVGENRVCVSCQSPCMTCTRSRSTCTTCINGYYFNPLTNECLSTCPTSTYTNQTSRTCKACISPCLTCQNSTTSCLTCISGFNFHLNQCLAQCPTYYYSSQGRCLNCVEPCLDCVSDTLCTSCRGSLYLLNQGCVDKCPSQYGKVVNNQCTQCDNACYSCQSSGSCTQCYPGHMLYLDQCITSCPTNYISSTVNSTVTCIPKLQPQLKLQSALTTTSSSLFPFPFTIFGLMFIGAGLISKLQNKNTYMIGFAYSIFGMLQTLVVLYVLYRYYFTFQNHQILTVYMLIGGLGMVAFLNVIAFIIQSCQFLADKKFQLWLKKHSCSNHIIFWLSNILSLFVNYKFRQILFTKIFGFDAFKAELQSVEKFKIANAFSFLGIIAQVELIYTLSRELLIDKSIDNSLLLTFTDATIILVLNVVFSVASSWKENDFFVEEIDGITINKKITVEGDHYTSEGLKDDQQFQPFYDTRKTLEYSNEGLIYQSDVIHQFPEEDSMEISENSEEEQHKRKTKIKLSPKNETLSSQTRRYKQQMNANQTVLDKRNKKKTKLSVFETELDQNQSNQQVNADNNQTLHSPLKTDENLIQEQIQQKDTKNISSNKTIENPTSSLMKNEQLQQDLHKNKTKLRKSSEQKSANELKTKRQAQQKSIQLQNSQPDNMNDNLQKRFTKKINNFQQTSKSLNIEQDPDERDFTENELILNEIEQKKAKVASVNSSRTDIFIPAIAPTNRDVVLIDSQSETVYNLSKLKPVRRQSPAKQLQSIRIQKMQYQCKEDQADDQNPPSKRKKYDTTHYQFQSQIQQSKVQMLSENNPLTRMKIQHMSLAESQQQQNLQEIEKSPLGFSPQSRIIENRQDSRDFSQDELMLQLNLRIDNESRQFTSEISDKIEGICLQTIEEKIKQSPKSSQQIQVKQISRKKKFRSDKVIGTTQAIINGKKLLDQNNKQKSTMKINDIYALNDLQQFQVPINMRQAAQKQQRDRIVQKMDSSQQDDQSFIYMKSKKGNTNPVDIWSRGRHLNHSNLELVSVPKGSNNTIQHPPSKKNFSKSSNHINGIDSLNCGFSSRAKNEELKDQLDNFAMQKVNFRQNKYMPTNYANEILQPRQANGFGESRGVRLSTITSAEILPKTYLENFRSLQKSNINEALNDSLQHSPQADLNNSNSLMIYYNRNGKSQQKTKGNLIDRFKSREGKDRSNQRNGPKDNSRWVSTKSKELTNQMTTKRFKQIEKIYLQKLH